MTQLCLLSLALAVIVLGLQYFDFLGEEILFTWLSWGFFSVVTPLVIGLAAMSLKTSTSGRSMAITLGAMGLKFILSMILIIPYAILCRPHISFIFPFFVFYIIFAIFETMYLMQMKSSDDLY